MNQQTIALIGNPNCGKTTLFNKLTGSRQKVGNWPGVTVEKKVGIMMHNGDSAKIIDLPGVYSLSLGVEQSSLDERIAAEFVLDQHADLLVNIIDAANLKRNLYLTLQLLEMQVPMIIAVNMLDIAEQQHLEIDLEKLSELLGCPVVPLVSTKGRGIKQLKEAISNYQRPKTLNPIMQYQPTLEEAVCKVGQLIKQYDANCPPNRYRWLAVRLLERDTKVAENVTRPGSIDAVIAEEVARIEKVYGEECDILFADSRYQAAYRIFSEVANRQTSKQHEPTKWLDRVFTHRWFGIPLFFVIMYLMFELSMNIGTLLQPLFDISSKAIFMNGVTVLGMHLGLPNWFTAIFAQGIGLGINTVVNFIPQIGLMFLFLSILEDSGYMARAAFVMDRFMQAIGLPGKSFVPLIVGFGCNVPSVMATRTLDSRRDRIMTCMMSPFMSCGARLAIFIVFASAFYPEHGGSVVFLLYITGIVVAMLTGLILNKTILRGKPAPFVLELPTYHMPNSKTILTLTWNRLRGFVIRAGKVIVPVCVLVGSLNAIQPNGHVDINGSQHSILSYVGRAFTPIFHPMGVEQDNWPATVGLITGTLAKEVVIGTLNTLYSQHDTNAAELKNFNLFAELKFAVTKTARGLTQVFSMNMMNPFTANEADTNMSETAMGNMAAAFSSQIAAFAYLLFVLLYIPCVSTVSVLMREVGKGWAWLSTFWSFDIAYTIGVIFYQSATWALHPLTSFIWIAGLLLFQALSFTALRIWGNRRTDLTYATGVVK